MYNAFCNHQWKPATCTEPEICEKCGNTRGTHLEHIWVEADCVNPKTCSLCKETIGEALGHEWKDADCETPKTCSVCDETEGDAPGHKWTTATCKVPKTCSVCKKTEGTKTNNHKWKKADCKNPKKCTVCGKTEGKAAGHKWIEATIDEAKKCSVCKKTEGKPLDYKKIGTGTVNTSSGGLNLREKPDSNSNKIALIPQKASVPVYDCKNSKWYYVIYDGKHGYVSSEFIKLNSSQSNNTSSGNNETSSPNFDSNTIVIPENSSAEIATEYERYKNAVNEINTYYLDMIEITESTISEYENDPDFSYQYVGQSTDEYQDCISELRHQVSYLERDTSGAHKSEIRELEAQIDELNDLVYAINYSNGIYDYILQSQEELEQFYYDWENDLNEETALHEANLAKLS